VVFESCPISAEIIEELAQVQELTIQLYCQSQLERLGKRCTKHWVLNIIIYGPECLVEIVGKFLSRYRVYLQDPVGCDRNVVYDNPHIILPETNGMVTTASFESPLGNLQIERLEVGPDLLTSLMIDEAPLPETEAPSSIITSLFPHQKQALTFMLRREQGWAMDEETTDIWTRKKDNSGRFTYLNNVNGFCQDEAPDNFAGGLLADDMGLGKTLSMICLIVADQACESPLPT
jgi:SWI/SNF-related matrix-associated actin-dependent regulator of chromatin subfamily A3